jgi:uncharacterized protein (DUF1778 family)
MRTPAKKETLMVRIDTKAKRLVTRAAELRRISASDYVREVVIAQAEREVAAAEDRTVRMSAGDQLAFWKALHAPVKLTRAQKKLGELAKSL